MKRELKKIAIKYGLKLLVVFGSQATDRVHKDSDFDFAFLRDKKLTLNQELRLRHDLFKLYKREIDLVDLKEASPLLLGEIAKKAECVFGSRREFSQFKVYAMKRFLDFEPYFKLREKVLNKNFT